MMLLKEAISSFRGNQLKIGPHLIQCYVIVLCTGARCSSMVRAFAHGAMGRRIDPS